MEHNDSSGYPPQDTEPLTIEDHKVLVATDIDLFKIKEGKFQVILITVSYTHLRAHEK